MHDPTEGGIATGLWELAAAAGVGLEILADQLPINPDCRALCERFDLDPLGIIASGSLLLTVDSQRTHALREALEMAGIQVTIIGRVQLSTYGVRLISQTRDQPLPTFDRDEIAKLFE